MTIKQDLLFLLMLVLLVFSGRVHSAEMLTLTWDPNTDEVTGYRVYTQPSPASPMPATLTQIAEVLNIPGNKTSTGRMVYKVSTIDLKWDDTNSLCFRLTAYNIAGMSGYSEAVCTTKKLNTPTGLTIKIMAGGT